MTNKTTRRDFIKSSIQATRVTLFAPALLEASSFAQDKSPARRRLSSYDGRVRALTATMTMEEKLGQMTQAEQSVIEAVGAMQKYSLGSLLCGGSSDPKAGNSLEAWTDMYDGYQSRALKSRLSIPI